MPSKAATSPVTTPDPLEKQSTKTAEKQTPTSKPMPDPVPDQSAAETMGETTLHTFEAINRSGYRMFAELNKEMGEFVAKRLKENLAVPSELLKCQSPQDVFNVYNGYCQRTIQQYTDEGQVMSTLGSQLLSETAKSIQDEASAKH